MALITGTTGGDTLTGTSGADEIFGLDGNDFLDGLQGADMMAGGQDDDWYYVDNAGDVVTEIGGEGNDRVFAALSYTLAAGAEVETLTTTANDGTTAIDLTGGNSANFIYGNDGANTLRGGGGNDALASRAGNDVLDGGTGADTMAGQTGNDWYYVDQSGDVVVENAGEGDDRVFAAVSYALAAGADVETLTTTDPTTTIATDLTGNAIANFIYGNDGVNTLRGGGGNDALVGVGGNDVLDGGTGADTMYGGTGDDWYYVDNAGDVVVENAGEGNDRIFASVSYTAISYDVDMLTTAANDGTAAIDLTGSGNGQFIYGNDGVNRLSGRGGNDFLAARAGDDWLDGGGDDDTLHGGDGADTFAFTTSISGPGGPASNTDTIMDFVSGVDRIALNDAVFNGLSLGALPANKFVVGTSAQDAEDRIIYDPATGNLYFDQDGSGAGVAKHFATLHTHPDISVSDFMVI